MQKFVCFKRCGNRITGSQGVILFALYQNIVYSFEEREQNKHISRQIAEFRPFSGHCLTEEAIVSAKKVP